MFLIIASLVCVAFILNKVIRSLKVVGFDKKYVFVTGCDSGFGQKLALRLDGLGFPVLAACLTEEGQKFLCENASTRLITLSLDITDSGSIQKAFEFVQSKLPQGAGLWAIVNNAGVTGPLVPAEMCPKEDWYRGCAVNLFGAIDICRTFLPLVRRAKGRVVNMVSMAGRVALMPCVYTTSKYAMEGFSDTLRRELYGQGIKVCIIEPGFFKTNIVNKEALVKSFTHYYDQSPEGLKEAYGGKQFYQQNMNMIDLMQLKANPNIDLVVNAYVHAITSQYPRTRYVIGCDAWLVYLPLSWLPGGVADWIVHRVKAIALNGERKKQN